MPFGFLDDFFETEQESTSSSQIRPWGPVEGDLRRLSRRIDRLGKTPLEMFPGQMYAPQTEAERLQIQALMDAAGQFQGQYGPMVMPALGMAMGAPDVANNPYVMGMADAIQSRVNRNLSENILPQLAANEVAGGGFGTRGAVAQGIAARGTQDVLSEALAGLYGNAYNTGMGAMLSGMSMAPQLMSGLAMPAAMYGQAGALERGEAQRAIDEEMARFSFAQEEPWMRYQRQLGMTLPLGTAFSEGSSSGTTVSTPSSFQQFAGIGMLGSAALGGLGQMQFGSPGLAGSRIGTGYNPYAPGQGPWGYFPYEGF